MSTNDLLFSLPPVAGQPVDLVFDEDDTSNDNNVLLTGAGAFPAFGGTVRMQPGGRLKVAASFPAFGGTAQARYASETERPTVGQCGVRFQQAVPAEDGLRAPAQKATQFNDAWRAGATKATAAPNGVSTRWQESTRAHVGRRQDQQQATPLASGTNRARYQESVRTHTMAREVEQRAAKLGVRATRGRYQEAFRDRRNLTAARFQTALGYWVQWQESESYGIPLGRLWRTRYQEARRPPIGIAATPVVPPADPCYIPPNGLDVALVFAEGAATNADLLFICERHGDGPDEPQIVVPVRSVYLTVNSATLIRVDNGYVIPAPAMSMSIDVDSWTWAFSASVPGSAQQYLERVDGDPVVVQATINGTALRFVIESVSRERTFPTSNLRIQGRGLSAELDAPYAPILSFGNTSARTSRQLLDDVLTFNGVPLDWSITSFAPTEWTVPSGVFSHQGTYISALNAIAGAAGGYIQPHDTNRTLSVLLRYPTPSWAWADATPDIVLPAAVTTREGIEWADKPNYNRVYVSGQDGGVHVRYSRAGTAGDLLAPGVVDPLITAEVAGRQRGRTILSDTGRIATVTLRLPVLSETGIIKPGKLVQYVDGSTTRIGMTRSLSLDVGMPTIYQNLTVETHE